MRILNLDKRHRSCLTELNKVILQVHLGFLKQDIRFLCSLALHLHEEAVVDILANYTVLIDVGTVLNVFQVPVIEIGEVKVWVDHGEAESLIAEEVIDLLLLPTCLFCRRI